MTAVRVETPPIETMRRRFGRKWAQHPADVLPAWIADMDFLPAPSIREALLTAVNEGDLGYGPTGDRSGVAEAFAHWALRRWQWQLDPQAVMVMPDVVSGLANCIDALTEPGDAIVVQTPIYPPFLSCIRRSGRRLVASASIGEAIDFDALETAISEHRVRMFMLCNPHNPTGRCFTRQELLRLAALAQDYDLTIVSDEVHADLVYRDRRHFAFASLGAEAAMRSVTLNSASKAFNVAGLRCAVCVAPSSALRRRLMELPPQRWTPFSTLGVQSTLAAWSDAGASWLSACTEYLSDTRDHLIRRLGEECPGIECVPPQASYLAWLDCRALGLASEPGQFFLDRARVALSPGLDFGEPGRGHARLNFATSREILDRILDRMIEACSSRVERVTL
jgi:cysteine-S-conjugate beta-lyase